MQHLATRPPLNLQTTLEKCAKCRGLIADRIVRALGKGYHPGCFCCAACGRAIGTESFAVDERDEVYCVADFYRSRSVETGGHPARWGGLGSSPSPPRAHGAAVCSRQEIRGGLQRLPAPHRPPRGQGHLQDRVPGTQFPRGLLPLRGTAPAGPDSRGVWHRPRGS